MAPKNESKVNGKSKSKPTESQPNEKPGSLPLLLCAVVATLAFIAGVLTPPARQLLADFTAESTSASNGSNTSKVSTHLPHVPCTQTNLDNYLHAAPVNGLHVICIESLNLDAEGNEKPHGSVVSHQRRLAQSNSLRLTFYKQSIPGKLKRRVLVNGAQSKGNEGSDVYQNIVRELGLKPSGENKQPWAIFSALGERIADETDHGFSDTALTQLASSEMVILTEGGNWIWPGVAEGFRRKIDVTSPNSEKPREVTIETLSLQPLVVSIEGFLVSLPVSSSCIAMKV